METGPCGISCTICRFKINGHCQCRIAAGTAAFGEASRSLCPVLHCSTANNIKFCARDCGDFPCLLLERTIPFRWSIQTNQNTAGDLPGWRTANSKEASQDPEALRVFCLGQFRVFHGSIEVQDHQWGCDKGPTHKIKAMLTFLLFQEARGARKDTLIDLFWPQQTNLERATSSFHQALFYLRRALEPDLEAGQASSFVQHQGNRYYFDPQTPCWIDTDAFAFYTNRAMALEQLGNSAATVMYWEKALDLYRGEFLTGIDPKYTCSEFYDWYDPLCFHFRQLYLAAKIAVAHHHLDLQQHDLAMEHAREVLRIEPAFEEAHYVLIRCLMEIGQPYNALRQYRLCETKLDHHKDCALSDQTRSLYKELFENLRLI